MDRGIGATVTRGLALAACVLLVDAAAAAAATINVNTTNDVLATGGSFCSLREAINDVDTPSHSSDGDCTPAGPSQNTIVLTAGDYHLSLTGSGLPAPNATGELVVTGSTSSLTISGAGAGSTMIDAAELGDRVLEISPLGPGSAPAVALQNLTIAYGTAPDAECGGGVFSAESALTLTGVAVTNNQAGGGPGGAGSGGGICADGPLTVENSTISNNVAGSAPTGPSIDGVSGGSGGGIFAGGSPVEIEGSTIAWNFAGDGGGGLLGGTNGTGGTGGPGGNGGGVAINQASESLTVEDSTIASNFAGTGGTGGGGGDGTSGTGGTGGVAGPGGYGGGIYTPGAVVVENSTISANSAGRGGAGGQGGQAPTGGTGGAGGLGGWGGALFTAGVSAVNATFSGNATGPGGVGGVGGFGTAGSGGAGGGGSGGGVGGAIVADPSSATTLTNVTIAGNEVGSGGVGGPGGFGSSGDGTSGGTSIAGFVADLYDEGASTVTLRDSITATGEGLEPCLGPGVIDGGHNLLEDGCVAGSTNGVDPRLGPLANNGGPTQTMALLPGSPAIGLVPAGSCAEATDQRGVARPQGAACDAGAYEFAAPAITSPRAVVGSSTTGTVTAQINPNLSSQDTVVSVRYGKTPAYGSSTGGQDIGRGDGVVAFQQTLSGLTPATTYYVEIVATNGDGTSAASAGTFTTLGTGGSGVTTPSKPEKPKLHETINHKHHSAEFTFRDNGARSLQCALVKANPSHTKHPKPPKPRYASCRSPKSYKHLTKGSYEFFVRGINQSGVGTPATFKFTF